MAAGYAVLDTETTGFTPGWHRVVEIGVVQLDADGTVVDEWCTLINPERDLGPQHVHGITSAEVRQAPVFADIAGDLAERLAGRVLVAHNLSFDVDFLAAEYARLGLDVPLPIMPGLCTMRLADRYLRPAARSLAACCAAAGVPLTEAHSALHDAYAAAGLLVGYLQAAGTPEPWRGLLAEAAAWRWPRLPDATGRIARRGAACGPREHFLSRLPEYGGSPTHLAAVEDYLTMLDAALLDRHLSLSEEDCLVEFALSVGLSRVEALGAHRRYLEVVARAAALDGAVGAGGRTDLSRVASLIGLGETDVDGALRGVSSSLTVSPPTASSLAAEAVVESTASADPDRDDVTGPAPNWGHFRLRAGDRIVFTGQTRAPRDGWTLRTVAAGLVEAGYVTRKTRLVVAADPDSLSGKARRARSYGIPIITEDAYAVLLSRLTSAVASDPEDGG
ncbi:DNA polymerase-3 subunit epsilon [Actinoalloteichus hoggarensis]|uniref:DNA polymerase III PolC-type n=1 Tax=Actinoalloteichus hoggarensis TaxID=1470176 RepID=A0A221W8H9_9PSEU|nr:exonuclease domain-containing protein [Actinoalloteichus hoggarensis]ASO21981.1 DNA polymerase III PolC-type [Actinoalloteichus hoggarensis]MBB5923939.1 DNA polymerase-3 subunit epsilon [Actinoalloteichus hoggarensis]